MARRRTKGEGSLFDSPKGSGIWFAQVTLPDGKQVQRKGPSQKQAQAKLKELLKLLGNDVNLGEKDPTLWAWWQLWLDHFASNLKPHIREDYRGIGRRYVEGTKLGKTRLRALTFAAVQAWVNELGKSLKPQTVKNAHARLRKALNVAKRKGYVDRNVAEGVELPSAGQIEAADLMAIQPYTFDQAVALLTTLAGNRWLALYRLAINLGLRQAELLGLTWDCVDLEKGTITVQQQLRRVAEAGAAKGSAKTWQLLPPKTTAAKRTLRLDPALVDVLRLHRKNLLEERLLHGKDWQARDPWQKKRGGLVFVTETGAPIHGSDLLQHFHRWAKKAGTPLVRFHDLRHTAATLMIADGRSIPAVSKVLGHANPGITLRIYAHAHEDAQAEAIGGLSKKLRGL
jgi:integrase